MTIEILMSDEDRERLAKEKFTGKQAVLEEALVAFRDSTQRTDDYMNLFLAVQRVLRQGDGLLWSDVEEVVKANIND